MLVLFDGEPHVHYGQIYLDSRGEANTLLDEAFAGQANGLCGAALGDASLRVRYCARGMDAARALDTAVEGEPARDRYLVQLWPAPPAPDRVVKQTSEVAAYWHDFAHHLPPPPSSEEVAQAQVRADLERERQIDQHWVNLYWGGRAPSECLRGVGGNN